MKADQNGHGGGSGDGRVKLNPELSRRQSVDAHHEVSDVELRGIIVFLIGLTVMTVVVYVLMLLMFKVLDTRELAIDQKRPQSPLALSEKDRLPPEPRLQSAPGFAEQLDKEVGGKEPETAAEKSKPKDRTWELDQLRQKWEDELKDGPRDQRGNRAGISIDQAKEQVLSGSGLPARATVPRTGGPEDYTVGLPTAASSGRMTEQGKQ